MRFRIHSPLSTVPFSTQPAADSSLQVEQGEGLGVGRKSEISVTGTVCCQSVPVRPQADSRSRRDIGTAVRMSGAKLRDVCETADFA
ncbi:hypothetical protein SAMN05443661_11352 [Natronobacterium gregoryi]|uniref:Uncharacterized protein n=2 Tax=Natronobacterium gregoryi TaxID=44930 RepID=L0ALU8_NATGS|nr:hypothetical protein Natgr_2890 [Natronobacterium gregoryi SP2]SFJ07282.1 hypothetical protein SAMN05443661_11352 [Natronobacterium gregoryi]